jgi:hypothetical protein
MATKAQTKDPKELTAQADANAIVNDIAARPLSATEKAEVEQTFAEAKDFRSL